MTESNVFFKKGKTKLEVCIYGEAKESLGMNNLVEKKMYFLLVAHYLYINITW